MKTTLKMKIVLRPSGNGQTTAEPTEPEPDLNQADGAHGARPPTLPPGERHFDAATEARESLRILARQRVIHKRVRRIKRAAWAVGAAALGWGAIVASRTPDDAAVSTTAGKPPALVAVSRAAPPAGKPAPAAVASTTYTTTQPGPLAAPITAAAAKAPGFLQGPAQPDVAAGLSEAQPAARCEGDFGQGRWRAAINSCGLAFDEQPGAPLALKIAHAHWSSGKVDRAATWARKAVALGTDDADAFVLIGHSERQSGDVASAMTAYRRYLRLSPRGWHAKDVRAALRDLKAKAALQSDVASAAPGAS